MLYCPLYNRSSVIMLYCPLYVRPCFRITKSFFGSRAFHLINLVLVIHTTLISILVVLYILIFPSGIPPSLLSYFLLLLRLGYRCCCWWGTAAKDTQYQDSVSVDGGSSVWDLWCLDTMCPIYFRLCIELQLEMVCRTRLLCVNSCNNYQWLCGSAMQTWYSISTDLITVEDRFPDFCS